MAVFDPSMLGSLGNQPKVRSLLQMLGWQDPNAGGSRGRASPDSGSGGQSSDPYAAERARYGSYDFSLNAGASDPKISSAAEAAAQGGTTPAGLMAGFFPSYVSDNVQGYRIPSDRGGFFTAEDLFRDRNLPQMGSLMQGSPSTNNWRLLGMGPGWIMRNGQLINANDSGVRWGGPRGYSPNMGNSGEQTMLPNGTRIGTGTFAGAPNALQAGLGTDVTYGWPGADQWLNAGRTSSG